MARCKPGEGEEGSAGACAQVSSCRPGEGEGKLAQVAGCEPGKGEGRGAGKGPALQQTASRPAESRNGLGRAGSELNGGAGLTGASEGSHQI